MAEQVVSDESEIVMKKVQEDLEDDYVVFTKMITASFHGDATHRKRLWLIGFRKDVYYAAGMGFVWPKEKFFRGQQAQVEEMVKMTGDPGVPISNIPTNGHKIDETDVEKVASKYGSKVTESLSGKNVHSVYGPLWTVRSEGMGGLIHVPGSGNGRNVRPLTMKECTLVQGMPIDYYETMKDLGMRNACISKAAAMGWPIRTGCSVLERVMEVLKSYYRIITSGMSQKCFTERKI